MRASLMRFPQTVRRGNAYFGLIINIMGLAFNLLSFASPTWLQSFSRIHTPFSNLGLWIFCLNGLIYRLDINMQSYYGCWWIFSPELDPIRDFLTPWWFIIVQVLMSITLAVYILSTILMLLYISDYYEKSKSREVVSKTVACLCVTCGCLIFVCMVLFGYKQLDPEWMPYPSLNWPSWGYGLACLSGFFAFITAFYVGKQAHFDKTAHYQDVYNFPLVNKTLDKK